MSCRRAGIRVDTHAVGSRRHADHVSEGFGEFAGVVISELSGNIEHGSIRFPQQPRGTMHFP